MNVCRDFIAVFSDRFERQPTDDWLRSQLSCEIKYKGVDCIDPDILLRQLQLDLDKIYVPTTDGTRIAKWIYEIARGFVAHRYQSKSEYVDVCMTPASQLRNLLDLQYVSLDPDAVPIYGVHGLPGAGKSALARALTYRVLPQPSEFCAEGNPPQKLRSLSTLYVPVNINFSLLNWTRETLAWLGPNIAGRSNNGRKPFDTLARELFKALYRLGVGVILVDELQFASGRTSAKRAISHLFAMRSFGIPIVFFANSDFIDEVENARAQISGRIKDIQVLAPLLRNDPVYYQIIMAQLGLVPYGSNLDIMRDGSLIYDMTAGLPRGSGRLIEVAARSSIGGHRQLTFDDILLVQKSSAFAAIRRQAAILRALTPIDRKKYPELASNNTTYDPVAAYHEQMKDAVIEDAAALALYGAYSEIERERANAVSLEILRRAGKIGPNVAALGESRRKRTNKKELEERILNSYSTKHLTNFSPKNPGPENKD